MSRNPVLPFRDTSDTSIHWVAFVTHWVTKATQPPILPLATSRCGGP